MAQKRETRDQKRVARRKKTKIKREGLKSRAKRMGLQDEFGQSLDLQNRKLAAQAKVSGVLWDNQQKQQAAIDLVEEEFCVLGRTLIPKVNELLVAAGKPLITEQSINKVFEKWHEFKNRPDFKQHFVPWFLGVPLDQLPPPPKIEEPGVEGDSEDSPSTFSEAEGAQEFGGDYEGTDGSIGDETATKNGPENTSSGEEDEVPEGQDTDGSSHRATG
jgi:hypothetical protein